MATKSLVCTTTQCDRTCRRPVIRLHKYGCRRYGRTANLHRPETTHAVFAGVLPVSDPFGTWAGLAIAAAAGLWYDHLTQGMFILFWWAARALTPDNVCVQNSVGAHSLFAWNKFTLSYPPLPGINHSQICCFLRYRSMHRAEKTKVGKELSAALVATLIGLALSNVGVMNYDAPQYGIVNSYLLPLAIPMLLLSANLRDVLSDTGKHPTDSSTGGWMCSCDCAVQT